MRGGCWACWVGGALAAPALCRPSSPHRPGAGITPSVNHPHTRSRALFRALMCTCTADCSSSPGTCPQGLRGSSAAHIQPPGWLASLWAVLSFLARASPPGSALSSVRPMGTNRATRTLTLCDHIQQAGEGRIALEQKITTRKSPLTVNGRHLTVDVKGLIEYTYFKKKRTYLTLSTF